MLQVWVDLVAELFGVTLGPKGKTVVLHNKYGPPKIVNDGDCSQRGFLLSFFLVIHSSPICFFLLIMVTVL
jgi:chaperonin GroEL (HSP60 family)